MATVKKTTAGNFSFTVPAGVTSLFVQAVGGGGLGFAGFQSTPPGGGYGEKTIAVTPGQVLSGHVGDFGGRASGTFRFSGEASWFVSTGTVQGAGGAQYGGLNPQGSNVGDVTAAGSAGTTTQGGAAGGPFGGAGGIGSTPPGAPGGGGAPVNDVSSYGAVGAVWITYNSAPSAPTLTAPETGSTIPVDQTNDFTWTFNDADSGDAQSEATLRWKPVAESTWTEEVISGSTASWTAPVDTFTDGVDYEWQVKTKDTNGPVYGPYSASSFFTGGVTPADVTITDPADGATIGGTDYEVEWTTDDQQAYEVRVVADDGTGEPDFSTTYVTTGVVFDPNARSRVMPFPTNNVDRVIVVRRMFGNVFSLWSHVAVHVEYTPPPKPTAAVTTTADPPTLTLTITNPAPSGAQPDLDHNEVWVNDTDAGWQRRAVVAGGGSWTYETPASTLDYDPATGEHLYVLAVGVNGSGTSSADDE